MWLMYPVGRPRASILVRGNWVASLTDTQLLFLEAYLLDSTSPEVA